MPRPIAKTVLAVLGWLLLLATIPAGAASAPGACSVTQAQRDVNAAKRAVRRADARLREARHVLSATKAETAEHGARVGRWVRCARRAGYPWSQIGLVMDVTDDESDGIPGIPNAGGSGALGLMQVMPEWADGSKGWYWKQWGLPAKWDRTNPVQTYRHTRRMDWSNWGRRL